MSEDDLNMIDLVLTHLNQPWGPPRTLETVGDHWRHAWKWPFSWWCRSQSFDKWAACLWNWLKISGLVNELKNISTLQNRREELVSICTVLFVGKYEKPYVLIQLRTSTYKWMSKQALRLWFYFNFLRHVPNNQVSCSVFLFSFFFLIFSCTKTQ